MEHTYIFLEYSELLLRLHAGEARRARHRLRRVPPLSAHRTRTNVYHLLLYGSGGKHCHDVHAAQPLHVRSAADWSYARNFCFPIIAGDEETRKRHYAVLSV